jgi:peroxiredoxin
MVMYDGSTEQNRALADELGLTFPVVSDTSMSLFDRWDPTGATPSGTFLDRGSVVSEIDVIWYPGLIEELVYGEGN